MSDTTAATAAAWTPNTYHCEGLVLSDANVDALASPVAGTYTAIDPNDICLPKSSWFEKWKLASVKTESEEDAYYTALTQAQKDWIQGGPE